jgi:FAD/FMN-containing dehydrogenase
LSVDASRFFADELSQTVDLAGVPLRLPCLEMLFLHAVVHLASRQTRLSTMVDIARLASAPDFRPSMVNRLAAEEGLAGLVDWALGETRTLSMLELPVDGAAVVDWRQRWPTRFWLAHQTLGRAAQLLSNAPEGQRLVVVSRVVWPEQEFLEIAQRTRRNQLSYMVSLMRGVVLRGRARVPVQEGGLWR